MGQRQAAVDVLQKAGRPMKTAEIAKAMIEGGYPFNGGDYNKLAGYLFTSFKRAERQIKKVGVGLWEAVKPPVNYSLGMDLAAIEEMAITFGEDPNGGDSDDD
jgi:hypothetical protein